MRMQNLESGMLVVLFYLNISLMSLRNDIVIELRASSDALYVYFAKTTNGVVTHYSDYEYGDVGLDDHEKIVFCTMENFKSNVVYDGVESTYDQRCDTLSVDFIEKTDDIYLKDTEQENIFITFQRRDHKIVGLNIVNASKVLAKTLSKNEAYEAEKAVAVRKRYSENSSKPMKEYAAQTNRLTYIVNTSSTQKQLNLRLLQLFKHRPYIDSSNGSTADSFICYFNENEVAKLNDAIDRNELSQVCICYRIS
jgi:uncharacterized protein YuzE